MAQVFPFSAYRYTPSAGPLDKLVTQPYDKITAEMRARYLAASPHNLVRVILGESSQTDSPTDNVYTRAAAHLNGWISSQLLARDPEPSLFAYFQEFTVPDTGERLVRQGFIGAGAVEDYPAGVVYRHERTLSGPKKDRLELLRHTRAHFGQIFMLYPDPAGGIDRLLEEAAAAPPAAQVADEYGAIHRLWRIADPARIARIQALMADKKLLIADGHHRYETALAFRDENPGLAGARRVMMTFVNMHSPGLTILATHRLVSGLAGFVPRAFLARAAELFHVEPLASLDELKERWTQGGQSWIGAAMGGDLHGLSPKDTAETLDVRILHDSLLGRVLGIAEDAVREQKYIRYLRGLDAAAAEARSGAAQAAFLLKPASVQQVAAISFAGGVMPQKSTDFYPKLLSGLTIYRLEEPARTGS
ncbi:MAG: DUF1015 domain-containing protein [Candidatus Solibacter usitatus]|nr:DUF1015 domain-containing protein [Candidatus Solibacter usitatus]